MFSSLFDHLKTRAFLRRHEVVKRLANALLGQILLRTLCCDSLNRLVPWNNDRKLFGLVDSLSQVL